MSEHEIPDNLKAEYAVARSQKNSWPREYVVQLIERIATLQADLKAAKDELHDRNEHIKYAYAALGNVNTGVYLFDHIHKLKAENERLYDALKAVTPEGDDWWCPTCKVALSPSRVTNSECCDTCGTYLAGVADPDWLVSARAAIALYDASKPIAGDGK